jgi:hypothetical protein
LIGQHGVHLQWVDTVAGQLIFIAVIELEFINAGCA